MKSVGKAGQEKILSLLVMNSISSGQIRMLFVIIRIKYTTDLPIFSILPEDFLISRYRFKERLI